MNKTKRSLILVFFALALILTACNSNQIAEETPIVDVLPTDVVIEEPVLPTEEPTPIPAVVNLVSSDIVFWAGPSSPHNGTLSERLTQLAQTKGRTFEVQDTLTADQITPSVKVLVTTADAGQIEAIAMAHTGLPIVAVDVSGLNPSLLNLYAVTTEGGTLEQRAFLAGYALALNTEDYRVGAITMNEDDLGNRTRDSFITGVRYHCGLCSARYMPVNYYPFTAQVSNPADPANWQAAVDSLLELAVSSIYVQPEISSLDLMTYLSSKNVAVIGVEGQAGLEGATRLMGVLGSDIYLSAENAVSKILDGEEPGNSTGSLELKQVNPDFISDGRLILFERVREDLLNGLVKDRP